jgi:hypothetical protein
MEAGKDELPTTGLAGEKATDYLDGIIWPVRHKLPGQRLNQFLSQVRKKYRSSDTGQLLTLLTVFRLDLITDFCRIRKAFERL